MKTRGQTLVLGALFLFLTTVLVLMTLSLGQRTRDRIEAQIAADAAAYSNAVVVARTLNQLALINRTRTSMLVAVLGMQSLISWSGHHRSHLAATGQALKEAETPYIPCCGNPFCPQSACSCAELSLLHGAEATVAAEQARVAASWDKLDEEAGLYAGEMFGSSVQLYQSAENAIQGMKDQLKHQLLAKAIVKSASPALDAPDKGDLKSFDETKPSEQCEGAAGLYCERHEIPQAEHAIMMGTRGWHFVTARTEKDGLIRKKLESLVRPFNGSATIEPPDAAGGAGVGEDREKAQKKNTQPYLYAIGEDHGGTLDLDWPSSCIPSGGSAKVSNAWVRSNHLEMSGDEHKYDGSHEPAKRHDLVLKAGSRDNWPWMHEYNHHELDNPKNDFGQPKLYAIVERSFDHKNPWDLTTVDFGDSRQVVLSSAMAYYHRPGTWKEPPTLWNPFWRATLTAPDDDLDKYIGKAGYSPQADTMKRLLKAGMAGTR